MEILAPAAPAVKSVNWYASTGSVPYTFGAQDAENKLPCVPEMYFVHPDDQHDYAAGYQSVAGATPTTRLFLAAVGKIEDGRIAMRPALPVAGAFAAYEADIWAEDDRTPSAYQLPLDGALQRMIDYGIEVQELVDARLDGDFVRYGC